MESSKPAVSFGLLLEVEPVRVVLSCCLGPRELARVAPCSRSLSELQLALRRCYLARPCARKTLAVVEAHLRDRYYCLPYVVRSPEDVALRKKMKSRKQPKRYFAALLRKIDVFWMDKRQDFPFHEFAASTTSSASSILRHAVECFASEPGSQLQQERREQQRPGWRHCRAKWRPYGPVASHIQVEWMLSHKDKLASNLRRFYGPEVANMIHPEAYSIFRGRGGGAFSLPDGIGRRLMETSLHSGSAVECRGKSLHQAAVAQKNGQSRSRKAKKQTGHRHRWIVKPATDACGHGIHIFDGDQAILLQRKLLEWYGRPLPSVHDQLQRAYVEALVIQRYIEDPFLLEGRKFDYRCYLLITISNGTPFVRAFSDGKGSGAGADSARSPLLKEFVGQDVGIQAPRVAKQKLRAFLHNGYVRSAGRAYNAAVSDENWAAHITNFSVQREDPSFDVANGVLHGVQVRQPYRHLIRAIQAAGLGPHIRKVNKRLKLPHARRTSLDVGDGASVSPPPQGNEVAAFDSETDISDMVQAQIQWLAARSVECVSQEWLSTASSGQFAILGLDYMLDQQGRFSLLEVTKGPALRMPDHHLATLQGNMLRDAVDIVWAQREGRRQVVEERQSNLANATGDVPGWIPIFASD